MKYGGKMNRNLLCASVLALLAACEKEPMMEDITIPPTMIVTPNQDEDDNNNGGNTTNSGVSSSTVVTGTTSDTTGLGPKTEAELNEEAEAHDCSFTYWDYVETCAELDRGDYTLFHRELGVRNGHTLRNIQQYYTDIYDSAKERVSQRFEDVVGHYTTIIEDNTSLGSYSFAGTCGTSWHDGSVTQPENTIGTLVHEWGHVWHSQLNLCEQETINEAWAAQRLSYENGTGYPQIQTVVGGDKENPVYGWNGETYPYQLSNSGEYMACNIAAYFNSPLGAGTIQDREDLRNTDPVIFEFLENFLN